MQVVEEIASAQATIELLLPQGDFAAALDILDSMRASCLAHPITSLHAFRHLPMQLIDIAEARTPCQISTLLTGKHWLQKIA